MTPAGDWLLGRLDAPPPPSPPTTPCRVQADLTVWVPRDADPLVRVHLEPLSDLEVSLAEADLYRVTRESIYRCLQAGGTVAEIRSLLETACGQPVPAPAHAALDTWGQEFGRLHLRTITVLEADTRETLQGLFARRIARRYLAETLSPRVAVVAAGQAEHLQRWLVAHGYLPRVELLPPAAAPLADLTAGEAAYLWLAAQVYRALARRWSLPLRLPQALMDRLETWRPARLDPGAARPWIAASEASEAALRRLDVPLAPAPIGGGDETDEEEEAVSPHEESPQRAVLVAQLEAAIQAGAAVALTYYTAGRDTVTERRVEPLRLEWWGRVPYLVAWCTWRRAERIFRIDRIRQLAVLTKQ